MFGYSKGVFSKSNQQITVSMKIKAQESSREFEKIEQSSRKSDKHQQNFKLQCVKNKPDHFQLRLKF